MWTKLLPEAGGCNIMLLPEVAKILLPPARHLEEGRGTTIFELLRLENCICSVCPSPIGSPPHTPQHRNRVKTTQKGAKTCFK